MPSFGLEDVVAEDFLAILGLGFEAAKVEAQSGGGGVNSESDSVAIAEGGCGFGGEGSLLWTVYTEGAGEGGGVALFDFAWQVGRACQ